MYFVSAFVLGVSCLLFLTFPETNEQGLMDTFHESTESDDKNNSATG